MLQFDEFFSFFENFLKIAPASKNSLNGSSSYFVSDEDDEDDDRGKLWSKSSQKGQRNAKNTVGIREPFDCHLPSQNGI